MSEGYCKTALDTWYIMGDDDDAGIQHVKSPEDVHGSHTSLKVLESTRIFL